mmetsp:Transcript_12577/g.34795  ORF Transcript_12577/g.34795 Transcript_12577/m.34795 type:complete len:289 (+) Transcript_12577:896-1762(+)
MLAIRRHAQQHSLPEHHKHRILQPWQHSWAPLTRELCRQRTGSFDAGTLVHTNHRLGLHAKVLDGVLLCRSREISEPSEEPHRNLTQRSGSAPFALCQQQLTQRASVNVLEFALHDGTGRKHSHEQLLFAGQGLVVRNLVVRRLHALLEQESCGREGPLRWSWVHIGGGDSVPISVERSARHRRIREPYVQTVQVLPKSAQLLFRHHHLESCSPTHGRSTSVHLEVQLVAYTKGELQQSHVRIVSVVPDVRATIACHDLHAGCSQLCNGLRQPSAELMKLPRVILQQL